MRAPRRLPRAALLLAGLAFLTFLGLRAFDHQAAAQAVRFIAVDVFVDPGEVPLAAYQFELVDEGDTTVVTGVEGGEHPAFREAPYYDPAALHREGRVIVAAFHLGAGANGLPSGRTRVATVHLLVRGEAEPELAVELQVAAGGDTQEIPAVATWARRE